MPSRAPACTSTPGQGWILPLRAEPTGRGHYLPQRIRRAAQHPRRGTAGAVRRGTPPDTRKAPGWGLPLCKAHRAAGREPAACHRRRPVQGAPYLPLYTPADAPGGFIRESNPVRTRDTLPTVHPRPARRLPRHKPGGARQSPFRSLSSAGSPCAEPQERHTPTSDLYGFY